MNKEQLYHVAGEVVVILVVCAWFQYHQMSMKRRISDLERIVEELQEKLDDLAQSTTKGLQNAFRGQERLMQLSAGQQARVQNMTQSQTFRPPPPKQPEPAKQQSSSLHYQLPSRQTSAHPSTPPHTPFVEEIPEDHTGTPDQNVDLDALMEPEIKELEAETSS